MKFTTHLFSHTFIRIMMVFLMAGASVTTSWADHWQGEGTQESPYLIESIDDWNNLSTYCYDDYHYEKTFGKYFKQTADLVYGEDDTFNIIQYFGGNYDGGNFKIKGWNLQIATNNLSMFMRVYQATLTNIYVEDCTIMNTKLYGGSFGFLVGTAENNTKITNCHVINGTLTEKDQTSNAIGGLVGRASSTILSDCSFSGSISTEIKTTPKYSIGGILGEPVDNEVVLQNCFTDYQGNYVLPFYGIEGFRKTCKSITECYYHSPNTPNSDQGGTRVYAITIPKELTLAGATLQRTNGKYYSIPNQTITISSPDDWACEYRKKIGDQTYDIQNSSFRSEEMDIEILCSLMEICLYADNDCSKQYTEMVESVIQTNNGKKVKLIFTRSFKKDIWQTLVLPFDMTTTQVENYLGKDVQVAYFSNPSADLIAFHTQQTAESTEELPVYDKAIPANTPVLIKPAQEVEEINIDTCLLNYQDAPLLEGENGIKMKGTYHLITMDKDNFFIANNQLWQVEQEETNAVFPTRAWFDVPETTAEAKINISIDDKPTTGIHQISDSNLHPDTLLEGKIYNLDGQRVSANYRGIVIQNGKKFKK